MAPDRRSNARANPGKLSYGSSGIGSPMRLAGEIDARRRADAHVELARRLAGGRTPNNTDHNSVFK